MKKITFLMLHLNYGGLEKQTITLINELAKQNTFEIEIISVYNIIGKSFYDLDNKVKVKYLLPYGPNKLEIKNYLKGRKYIKSMFELIKGVKILYSKYVLMKKEIARLKTDYIFSTRIEFSRLIKRKDTINIAQEHSYINTNKYIQNVKKSFNYIDYLIVMTVKAKNDYCKWLKGKKIDIICIPNMIEYNNKYVSDCKNKKIVSVGRLEDVKDFKLLLEIFDKIIKENNINDWKLDIVGSGSLELELKNKITSLDLAHNVNLLGSLPTNLVYKSLSESSMLVLTSKSESFSLVLCEAMNAGLPVVSFDIDVGPREIIQDNVNGYLIENRKVDEMKDKIITLMDNENLRKTIGDNAKQSVERYYSSNIVNQWLEIIK